MNMNTNHSNRVQSPTPWWRMPIMWLVIGGPVLVIVAGVVTTWIAHDGADVALRQVPRAADTARADARQRSAAPAQQVRNHVATPAAAPTARSEP